MLNYERLNEREEITSNQHPVATGISMFVLFIGMIAFASLAFAAGCSSPSDDSGDDDVVSDVDGSTTDQPDGNGGNCATNGTCPDAGSDTDAPASTACATNFWMENPNVFDCYEIDQNNGQETIYSVAVDPQLINTPSGCQIKGVKVDGSGNNLFWALPEQLTINSTEHFFDAKFDPEANYHTYRCRQRQ